MSRQCNTTVMRVYTDEMHCTLVDVIEVLDGLKERLVGDDAKQLDAVIAKLDAITWGAPQDLINVYRKALTQEQP